MDTQFWGPSAWKLLHMASFNLTPVSASASAPAPELNAEQFGDFISFFTVLPYILPCKFCRSSLTDYYKELPLKSCKTKQDVIKWVYDIHNRVNNKLRHQKLPVSPDPTLEQVIDRYTKHPATITDYWNFIFAVGYNHPFEAEINSSPIPNCPTNVLNSRSACTRNKWNILSTEQRMKYYRLFWKYLPDIFDNETRRLWIDALSKSFYTPTVLNNRNSVMEWLWKMRCIIQPTFHDPYKTLCKKISMHSSECNSQDSAGLKTCRRKTIIMKNTMKNTMKNIGK